MQRLEAGATAARDADDTQLLQGPPTWGWRLGATRDARRDTACPEPLGTQGCPKEVQGGPKEVQGAELKKATKISQNEAQFL